MPGGTAAGGNFTTSYTYSPLNQLLQVTMPRGGTTQYRTFSYNGQDMVSATNPENAAVSHTYDASHRALTRTDATSQQTQYTYNTLGQLTQVLHGTISNGTFTSDPTSTVSYTYDTYGRLNTLTSSGSTFATATYTAAGQLYQLSYGGLTETRTYNSMMQLIAQSVPGYLNLTYNYSPTQNNGRITSSVDGVTGESSSYSYDALNRLSAASNSLWSGSYAYDGFGNLTSKSGSGGSPNSFPSMTASYNSNNQLTTVSYDGNGNTSLASGYSYGYTVENKLNSRVSQYWPYGETLYGNDPSGRRVMKLTNPDPNNYEGEDNPLWEFYFYTINGQRLVTIDCNNANAQYQPNCWPVGENTYFGRRMLVSNGVYVVTDRLGTVRANTQGESFAYYPFGEERTSTVDGRDKFATYFRDTVGLDYAEQRYYNSSLGRFWSVDPGGIRTAHPGNPTSWNRYAYVNGDPVNFQDPHGLDGNCGPDGTWMGEGCYMGGAGAGAPTGSNYEEEDDQGNVTLYTVVNMGGVFVNGGGVSGNGVWDFNTDATSSSEGNAGSTTPDNGTADDSGQSGSTTEPTMALTGSVGFFVPIDDPEAPIFGTGFQINGAYIPQNNTVCLGWAFGNSVPPGLSLSGGILSSSSNIQNIIQGPSGTVSAIPGGPTPGLQLTTAGQAGTAGGPVWGTPGVSATVGPSACMSVPTVVNNVKKVLRKWLPL